MDKARPFPADHSRHGFCVDGMDGKEDACHEASLGPGVHGTGIVVENDHNGVDEEVGQMVVEGREVVDKVVGDFSENKLHN